jgi:hypothetical protein
MKTANWNARGLVQECRPFKGNNTFGERVGNAYVVYSYGTHWPLFVNVDGKWYENAGRYSVTTSKHRSQLHPLTETELMSVDELIQMIDNIESRIAA